MRVRVKVRVRVRARVRVRVRVWVSAARRTFSPDTASLVHRALSLASAALISAGETPATLAASTAARAEATRPLKFSRCVHEPQSTRASRAPCTACGGRQHSYAHCR